MMLRNASAINGSKLSMLSGRTGVMTGLFSRRLFHASGTGFDAQLAAEMPSFKVSPAASWWMRSYGVLPSQIKATGPRGYHTKGDVLAFIEANKITLRPREAFVAPAGASAAQPQAAAAPAAPAKKAAPKPAKKPKAQAAASPAFDPNDPF